MHTCYHGASFLYNISQSAALRVPAVKAGKGQVACSVDVCMPQWIGHCNVGLNLEFQQRMVRYGHDNAEKAGKNGCYLRKRGWEGDAHSY